MMQRTVESFVIPVVKDETLPVHIQGFDPNAAYITALLTDCPAIFTDPQERQETLPFNDTDPYAVAAPITAELAQTSGSHFRSFEVHDPQLPEVWTDEFGHSYGSLTLKGVNFSHPGIIETLTATDRLIAFGLQESSVIRRVLRASRILRTAGVSTEYIVGLAEPKEFPFAIHGSGVDSHEWQSLGEYKESIIHDYWNGLTTEKKTPEELLRIINIFSRMTFYVSARAMDTPVRLAELKQENTKTRVFEFANKHGLVPQGYPEFDATAKDEEMRFVEQVTIPRLAKNFAILHNKLRLAHRYPVDHNLTALGSIIDLDSVHGAILDIGDEEITAEDVANDLMEVANALYMSTGWSFVELLRQHDEKSGGEKRPEPVHQKFFEAYLDELAKLTDPAFTAEEIAYAALQLGRKKDKDDRFTILFSRNMIGQRIFQTFYGQNYEFTAEKGDKFLEWFKAYEVQSADNLAASSEQLFDEFMDVLYNELNYSGDINTERFLGSLYGEDGFDWNSSCGQYLMDAVASNAIENYTASLTGSFGGAELYALASELGSSGYAWTAVNDYVLSLIEQWKDRIYESFQIEPYVPFASDGEVDLMFRSFDNIFVHEEREVPLSTLIEACAADDVAKIIVKRYRRPSDIDFVGFLHGDKQPDYELSDPEFILTHVVSDDATDGYSYSLEPKVDELDIDISDSAEYVAFVECMPNGKKTVQIHITDTEFDPIRFKDLDKQQTLDLLRSNFEFLQRLFPIANYHQPLPTKIVEIIPAA